MKKLILSLVILVAAHSISYGGLLDRSVDFADLAKLSEDGLQALKHTKFEVFLGNVRPARARATRVLARERLKAAEANQDTERMSNVENTHEKVKEAIRIQLSEISLMLFD